MAVASTASLRKFSVEYDNFYDDIKNYTLNTID